ncbi:MAG TPA: methyltransferase domain-containing protein [Rhizomicrobium sp.]|nr:methyltransferase domain-containing protein [Rhizomicrobium sp.]
MSAPPRIFDSRTYAMHRARAAGSSFLAQEAVDGMAERLGAVSRRFARGLDVDSRDESFETLKPFADDWTRPAFLDETLSCAPESFDIATSILSLHAVNDLPGALIQIRRALKPDGLFIAALFGGETLRELRDAFAGGESEIAGGASPRVSPFADVRDLGGLLQRAGFALPVADVERTTIRYRAFATLIADLRAMGETNALAERSRRFLRRDVLAASLTRYAARHAEPDGRLRATFDIVYLTAWAPHASQQKPLAPGSARHKLADALGTAEQPAGDKTGQSR